MSTKVLSRIFHTTLFIAMISGPNAGGQELRIPVQQDSTVPPGVSQTNQIELKHGMSRQHVGQLMGPTAIESLIGSTDRSRATLSDGTELLFEQDCLIGIIEAKPGESTDAARLFFFYDRLHVIYEKDLVLSRPDNLPQGEDRRRVDEQFYFLSLIHI